MSIELPIEFLDSLNQADEDTLVQRRHAVAETLNFISGSTAYLEGRAYVTELDREIAYRRASGLRGRLRCA